MDLGQIDDVTAEVVGKYLTGVAWGAGGAHVLDVAAKVLGTNLETDEYEDSTEGQRLAQNSWGVAGTELGHSAYQLPHGRDPGLGPWDDPYIRLGIATGYTLARETIRYSQGVDNMVEDAYQEIRNRI